MQDIQSLVNLRQERFIEQRTKIKQEVERVRASFDNIPARLLEGITIPPAHTAEELFPSLWLDPPNTEQYKVEKENFTQVYNQIQERVSVINDKARKILEDSLNQR